ATQAIVRRPDIQNLAGPPPPSTPGSPAVDCSSAERRRQSVQFARMINSAEAAAHGPAGRYVPFESLGLQALSVDEYEVQITTDGPSYIFSIKDKVCHVAMFSDQNGVIYNASPLQ